ncbi:MAG TPA: 16S rRNA (guanine(966)-N(2))-methyltransferase RsmD [Geobacteraceae bacterium]
MRVIAGEARGRRLAAPGSDLVRPTADRVKEALFSILTSRLGTLHGCRVLDLFAGTGNLGIEALSRGARHAFFVDSHPESLHFVRQNLATTGLAERATVLAADVLKGIARLGTTGERFNLIFLDPPYGEAKLLQQAFTALADAALLTPGGLVIAETAKKTALVVSDPRLQLIDSRTYGTTTLLLVTTASGV